MVMNPNCGIRGSGREPRVFDSFLSSDFFAASITSRTDFSETRNGCDALVYGEFSVA